VLALVFVIILAKTVIKHDAGNEKMQTIANHIAQGAIAFLKAEYKVLIGFVLTVGILLALTANTQASSSFIGLAYILGAVFSGVAGYIGMIIATKANVRTTQAATKSLKKALKVSFHGGSVMGISVVALGLLGLSGLLVLFTKTQDRDITKILTVIT
jgi:K(+)-stimulated pyrophosphate-energized sodium pump